MDAYSTISWMMMGGSRDNEPTERRIEHLRALRESRRDQAPAISFSEWLTRLVGFLDVRTAQPRQALTFDRCIVEPCRAA